MLEILEIYRKIGNIEDLQKNLKYWIFIEKLEILEIYRKVGNIGEVQKG